MVFVETLWPLLGWGARFTLFSVAPEPLVDNTHFHLKTIYLCLLTMTTDLWQISSRSIGVKRVLAVFQIHLKTWTRVSTDCGGIVFCVLAYQDSVWIQVTVVIGFCFTSLAIGLAQTKQWESDNFQNFLEGKGSKEMNWPSHFIMLWPRKCEGLLVLHTKMAVSIVWLPLPFYLMFFTKNLCT